MKKELFNSIVRPVYRFLLLGIIYTSLGGLRYLESDVFTFDILYPILNFSFYSYFLLRSVLNEIKEINQ